MAYSICQSSVQRQIWSLRIKVHCHICSLSLRVIPKQSVEIVDINLTQAHFRPRCTPLVNCLIDAAAAVRSCNSYRRQFRSATSIRDMTGPVWDPGQSSQHRRRTGPVWVVRGLSRDGLWSGLTLGSFTVYPSIYPVSRVTLIRAG